MILRVTTATLVQSEANAQNARRGSHRITRENGIVTVHDVELFAGYDSEIHAGNEKMEPFDAAAVRKMVNGTAALIRRGQYPQIAVSHPATAMDGTLDARPSVGRIAAVRFAMRGNVPVARGDYQMSEADFDALVGSNRYPRRSVEIYPKPLRIGTVALLGGDTPASPVEDTMFSEPKRPFLAVSEDKTDFSEVGIGGGSPITPNYEWKASMTEEMKKEIMAICREAIAEFMSEREKTEKVAEEKVVEEKVEAMSASAQAALDAANARIAELENARKVDFADRKIAEFSAKGLELPASRKAEVHALLAAAGPVEGERIASLIADLRAGSTPTRRIDMSAATPAQPANRQLTLEETSRLAAKHAGNTSALLAAYEAARKTPAAV